MAGSISAMLSPECISLNLAGRKKPELIRELVGLLEAGGKVSDLDSLADEVIEREKLASTGIGSGIAIPHAMSETVDETVVAFGLKPAGVKFDAVDNQPVSVFFLIAGPVGSHVEHLQILSRLSRYLHDGGFCDKLRGAKSPQDVLAALEEKEQQTP